MPRRTANGWFVLRLVVALMLAASNSAVIAGAAVAGPVSGPGTMAATISIVHTAGMLHGVTPAGTDRTGGTANVLAQVLCLIACTGQTSAPTVAPPEMAFLIPPHHAQQQIAAHGANDQVLQRPVSPPPRAIASI
jgi:hypothetical protein